jgi:hypothetical protein
MHFCVFLNTTQGMHGSFLKSLTRATHPCQPHICHPQSCILARQKLTGLSERVYLNLIACQSMYITSRLGFQLYPFGHSMNDLTCSGSLHKTESPCHCHGCGHPLGEGPTRRRTSGDSEWQTFQNFSGVPQNCVSLLS